ncbi:MAG TPA: SUMF1/EgtB/PvdO family nonheme iron enzyme [Ktedonobacterales bacterium]
MTTPSGAAPAIPPIFVSHSHHDNTFCRPFVAHLRSVLALPGATQLFYDERALHAGDDWIKIIQREVVARPLFIVILTANSVAAPYVEQETNLAIRLTTGNPARRIFGLLVEPCDPAQLAPLLLNYQLVDMVKRGYDAAFDDLVAAIRAAAEGQFAAPGDAPRYPAPTPSMSPAAPDPRMVRGRALAEEAREALAQGLLADAIAKADAALERFDAVGNQATPGERADVLATLAGACGRAGQWQRALDAATRGRQEDPDRLDFYLVQAAAQRELNQPDQAQRTLDQARAVVPLNDVTQRRRLLAAQRALDTAQQQWTRALAALEEEQRLAPNDPALPPVRLDLLERAGQRDAALTLARQLTGMPGASAAQWLARARLARQTTDGEQADQEVAAALDAAARRAPTDPAITQARKDLFPPPIPPDRFPPRFAGLGFTPRTLTHAGKPVEVILPPLCAVPAGPFLMGSDPKQDRDTQDREKPRHEVQVAAFQIARFPVTVAEYACFVRDGHAAPDKGTYQPITWQEQLNRLDHPVVCVSWRDAVAYVAWLAQLTGQPWRLPTEAEWEKAARYDPATRASRVYPWGDAFDQSRANTSGSGRNGTTPVDSYPGGASPCGAQDMAGNVWEWTSSLYQQYPYNASDGRERVDSTGSRVLRGGSWNRDPAVSRAACRGDGVPTYAHGYLGARLVVARAAPGS